tara:strand:- start:500 stop:655 length:156 start_codon:yes stop_codon:yes gene_type:complete
MEKKKTAPKKTSTTKKVVEKKETIKEEDVVRNTVQVVPYVKRKTIYNTKKK